MKVAHGDHGCSVAVGRIVSFGPNRIVGQRAHS
jgi:hypothetical protein